MQPRPAALPATPTRRLRAALSWLHLWVGLVAGTLFALAGLSGSVLVFHSELLQWRHPQLAAQAPVAEPGVLAGVLDEWTPRGLSAIDFPRESMPAWQAYFEDGSRRYFATDDGALLLTRTIGDDALLWLHEFHVELLAGEAGHQVVGVVGWLALGLLVTGVYLWWPRFGPWSMHLKVYRGPPVRRWLSWHRTSGLAMLPLLLVVTLTGVGMVYHDGTRALLTGLFGGAPNPPAPVRAALHDAPPDWPRVLATAREALPGAVLVRTASPAPGSAVVGFRVRLPAEWHPNGRSLVSVDAAGTTVLLAHDATRQPLGGRIDETVYPLHIGAVGGRPYRWAVAVSGLLPAFLLVTGFLFWRRRRGLR